MCAWRISIVAKWNTFKGYSAGVERWIIQDAWCNGECLFSLLETLLHFDLKSDDLNSFIILYYSTRKMYKIW